jgi:hypothetical protein
MRIGVPVEPNPKGQIRLSCEEFLDGIDKMRNSTFRSSRNPSEA